MKKLHQKEIEVLWHIVDLYLEFRAPISSGRVASRLGRVKSPATIRSIMAELEKKNFLISTHCSSGRVPTPIALRFYLQTLEKEQAPPQTLMAPEQQPTSFKECVTYAESALCAMTNLYHCAGFFFLETTQAPRISHLDFVYRAPGRIVGMILFEDESVYSHVLSVPFWITPRRLKTYQEYLDSDTICGRSLEQVHQAVEARKGPCDLLDCLAYLKSVADVEETSRYVHIRGKSGLIHALSGTSATLATFQNLLQWMESHDKFAQLLAQLQGQQEKFHIFFGDEPCPSFSFEGFSLVLTHITQKNSWGAVGAIGPFHMDYPNILSIIGRVATIMGKGKC